MRPRAATGLGELVWPIGELATLGLVLVSLVPECEPDESVISAGPIGLAGLISIVVPASTVTRSSVIQCTVINSLCGRVLRVAVDQPNACMDYA